MSDEYYELYQQCKLERDQIKQQLEDIHYFSDAYCLYELEKNYNVKREDIKKVEYCGGHGYTAVRIHFSNGTSIYESDETLAGMLLAWAKYRGEKWDCFLMNTIEENQTDFGKKTEKYSAWKKGEKMTIYRVFEQDTSKEIFEHIIKIEKHEIELEQEFAKLKKENEKLKEALRSIAFIDEPRANTIEYWETQADKNKFAETLCNDTILAREVLGRFPWLEEFL